MVKCLGLILGIQLNPMDANLRSFKKKPVIHIL